MLFPEILYPFHNFNTVGNKIDLLDRQVTTTEASEFARDNGCFYMETSALDGTGINQAFYTGISSILFSILQLLLRLQ